MSPTLALHLSASTSSPPVDDDAVSFENFCIVCDRLIVPPKEKEVGKEKKKPAGAIRIKNADGTVTTRTATGQKTTRPVLRRGPSSTNRLVVAAANNAATKLQPLTRSKTAEGAPSAEQVSEVLENQSTSPSPPAPALKTPSTDPPFVSSIYCSRSCAQLEASRSCDVARRLSFDHRSPNHYPLGIITHGLPLSGDDAHKSPYGPPSPLFISESSDSSSNPDAPQSAGPACSAPNPMEFFRIPREGPDDAWHAVQKQRRSSMHPSSRPAEMARRESQQSQGTSAIFSGPSSDSLASMREDQETYFSRSVSSSGKMRMTPMAEREGGGGKRATSISSDRDRPTSGATGPTGAIAVGRPLPRSNLSHVSLTASPPDPIPVGLLPEFGSAPEHTLNLWNSYHAAFPVRDSISSSASSYHKGFVFPGASSPSAQSSSAATLHPALERRASGHPTLGERRGSNMSSFGERRGSNTVSTAHTPTTMAMLARPASGTIRAKSRTDVTWDSFGREEVMARSRRASRSSRDGAGAGTHAADQAQSRTPKQSLEMGGSGWTIKYHAPGAALHRDGTIRSASRVSVRSARSEDEDDVEAGPAPSSVGLPIPQRQLGVAVGMGGGGGRSFSNSNGRTPTGVMGPPRLPIRAEAAAAVSPVPVPVEALQRMRIEEATGQDAAQERTGVVRPGGGVGTSAPRSTFNWDEFERKGGRTYEIPKAIKIDTKKAGLFFFR